MLILGWHGSWTYREGENFSLAGSRWHDGSAVLLRDGHIVAAIEEERLSRIKHANHFPARAINFCLREAAASIDDLDAIAVPCGEHLVDSFALERSYANAALPMTTGRGLIIDSFKSEFGGDVSSKLHFCNHHLAHLYAAWYASGFSDGLAVCFDGQGEGLSGLVARCDSDGFSVLRNFTLQQSLGHFYMWALRVLGYRRFDEYKVMGLAPYGFSKNFSSLFEQFYTLLPDGQFEIAPIAKRNEILNQTEFGKKPRRKHEPFTQEHKDFAASVQEALERIVEHVLEYFRKNTGLVKLCVTGGVAHNCSMNGRILRSDNWENIFVQPAAHDAGNSLGAALSVCRSRGVSISKTLMPHLYYGGHIGTSEAISRRLDAWSPLVSYRSPDDLYQTAAQSIAEGRVIAWVQGRSEFGPRALGNRSILADPRPALNKDRINSLVKKREGYRPFAPAILEERLHEYFEVPSSVKSLPFMITTARVRPPLRETLGAVTHVDGSARVQTVSARTNPEFHKLIAEFEKLTKVPILLNTSFNNNCEPIVESVDDAVTCFLTTGLDYLCIGNHLVSKTNPKGPERDLLNLVVTVPKTHKLVRRAVNDNYEYSIEFTNSASFAQPSTVVSAEMYRILSLSDGKRTMLKCCRAADIDAAELLENIASELALLWECRVVQLRPNH